MFNDEEMAERQAEMAKQLHHRPSRVKFHRISSEKQKFEED